MHYIMRLTTAVESCFVYVSMCSVLYECIDDCRYGFDYEISNTHVTHYMLHNGHAYHN